jgi:HEAT repeat protein
MRIFVALVALATALATAATQAPAAQAPALRASPLQASALRASALRASALQLISGTAGALEIRKGNERVGRLEPKTPLLRRGTPALVDRVVAGHPLVELRIPILGTPGEEVWIGEIEGRAGHGRRVVWSGTTGPRDSDGETSIWIEVSPERVTEFQTAAEITRCDGQPPRLFPRAYDFESGRFRPILPPLPPPGIEKLVAHRGDPAMPAGHPIADFHWTAASTTRGAGTDARALTAPVELDDGNPATAWAEGLGSDGRGEFLTAHAATAGYAVTGLRIFPGDGASLHAFRANNRLRRFQIVLGPAREQRFDVEIPDEPAADPTPTSMSDRWREPYWVPLPKPIVSSCVTAIVTEVTYGTAAVPPKSYGTTAIGELAIFTDADGPDAGNRLVSDLASAPDCAARLPLVVGLGEAVVLPTAQAVLTAKGAARECLIEALTTIEPVPKNPIVIEALTAAVSGASETEERLVGTALARAPTLAVSPLTDLLSSKAAPVDDRARAARLLGRMDDEGAVAALLAAIGSGPPSLRTEIVEALGRARRLDADLVLAAFAASEQKDDRTSGRAADLLRLISAAVKRRPDGRGPALAAVRGALAPDRAFEVRGRAILALGALGMGGDPVALASLRSGSDDPVLRFLATRELGNLKTVGAAAAVDLSPALRAALDDPDPRVRETAAAGLGNRADVGATAALIAAAKQEPWPFVRRAEIEALGRLCRDGTGDLLIRATERDVDEVRRAALVGLARCKDPRASLVFLRTLGRRDDNASLRELAAGLLGELGGQAAAREMVATLRRIVVESEADLALEGVAVATLRAVAHLGGADAVAVSVTLAADTRHPFRAAAIDALGTLCDPGAGHVTLEKMAAGSDGLLARVAERAERRCAPK